MSNSPLVKICGVTRPGDADLAVDLGANLVGLNFYPPSPRCLTVEAAREIVEVVAGRVPVAGVFVDRPRAEIEEIVERAGLDLVQLHGDETPAEVAAFGGRAIQVFRVEPEVDERLDPGWLRGFPTAWGFLFDVRHPRYGGTGLSWDYRALARVVPAARGRPVLVAGGIGPETVAAALAASDAGGIDVCSGVESAPGIKDPLLLERLMAEVRGMAKRGDDRRGKTAAGDG